MAVTRNRREAEKGRGANKKERACRRCGCTWSKACMTKLGPCSWVGRLNICSACLTKAEMTRWLMGIRPVVMADGKWHLANDGSLRRERKVA